MLQRIQSLYLLLSLLATAVCPFFFYLWKLEDGVVVFFRQEMVAIVIFGLVSAVTLMNIFNFKKRQNQFVVNRLSIILNFILLGFFVYRTLSLSGETIVSEKGIGIVLPAISIVLLVLANKAIKKDEDLVKSVDRLR